MRAGHAIAGCVAALALSIASTASARDLLDRDTLLSGSYRRPVDLSAYAPPSDARPPLHRFEGRLRLSGQPATRTVVALRDFVSSRDTTQARSFPQDLELAFVQHGDVLIPTQRGPIPGTHPWWEISVEAGKVWNEAGDGDFSRAAIPFALVQRNANCTHNGVLMLLFDGDGTVSRVAMQIGSETCHYLQLDMWGLLRADYAPEPMAGRDALIAAHDAETARRLPVKPIAALAADHPGIDPTHFAIGAARARTVHGVIVDGVHYRSQCHTRHGTHPFCDALDIPSYSVAKSVVAGLALMRMQQLYPGIAEEPVSRHARASGCMMETWDGVTLRHLLDMSTGQYDAAGYMADEDSPRIGGFFAPDTHAQRLAFACEAYPRREAPGARWVYHTSDTYLLGTVLQNALRRISGRERDDVFDDMLWTDVLAPLHLSPTARVTRRSYDKARQPLFGWGLTLLSDDIAKLARFLGEQQGRIDGQEMLDAAMFAAAMQRDPEQRGLQVATLENFRYQHGFWARNLQAELGCEAPTWVPFLSGFGGITVALFPNGVAWYNVADDGLLASIDFAEPAIEAAKIRPICRQ